MNNLVRFAAIAMIAAAGSGAAQATALLTGQFSKVGLLASNAGTASSLVKVSFQGVSDSADDDDDDDKSPAQQYSNISGTVDYQLQSVMHSLNGSTWTSSWQFLATVTNTSAHPMTSARISTFGFSTAAALASGNNPPFLHIGSANIVGTPGVYENLVVNNGGLNLPKVAGSNNPQICLKDGGNSNNCSGGAGGGVELGDAATSTAFALHFTGPAQRTSLTLHNFFLRFQSLEGTGQRVGGGTDDFDDDASGVGIVTKLVDPVPEPSSWAMLIAGFGLVGTTLRRRRSTAVAAV